jgi:UDP-galactopyranose mutase
MQPSDFLFIVVGAGVYGSIVAERIASQKNEKVLVVEKRNHIGGNCFSEIDAETGIEVHKYGSHIFHTDNMKVWEYISRFMSLNSYRHHVLTVYKNVVYQMPINLDTINRFYQKSLKPYEVAQFIRDEIKQFNSTSKPQNLEEKAISLIGKPLYDAFIKGYTHKQWEVDPVKLPPDIITRLPIRLNYKSEYFDDPIQGIPLSGYSGVFQKLLSHKNITVLLNTDYDDIKENIPKTAHVVYTGPIDRFFNYRFGELGWRSIDLEREIIDVDDFQGTAVMNYADFEVPYTRIHEFKHYHPERKYKPGKTVISKEYSRKCKRGDEPYYPINTMEDKEKLEKYKSIKVENVYFGGRLGSYQYLDMDDAIAAALNFYEATFNKL